MLSALKVSEGQPNLHGRQNVSGGFLSYFSVVLDFSSSKCKLLIQ